MQLPKQLFPDPSKVLAAPWNPPRRALPTDSDFKELMDSLETEGQLKPASICPWPGKKNYYLSIDGTRRAQAMILLNNRPGLKAQDHMSLWSVFHDVDLVQAKRLYCHINQTQRAFTSNDILGIWLQDRHTVSDKHDRYYQKQVKLFGLPAVKRLYNAGRCDLCFDLVRAVARAAHKPDHHETLVTLLDWMIEYPVMAVVRDVLTMNV